jgi:hypothetical protein
VGRLVHRRGSGRWTLVPVAATRRRVGRVPGLEHGGWARGPGGQPRVLGLRRRRPARDFGGPRVQSGPRPVAAGARAGGVTRTGIQHRGPVGRARRVAGRGRGRGRGVGDVGEDLDRGAEPLRPRSDGPRWGRALRWDEAPRAGWRGAPGAGPGLVSGGLGGARLRGGVLHHRPHRGAGPGAAALPEDSAARPRDAGPDDDADGRAPRRARRARAVVAIRPAGTRGATGPCAPRGPGRPRPTRARVAGGLLLGREPRGDAPGRPHPARHPDPPRGGLRGGRLAGCPGSLPRPRAVGPHRLAGPLRRSGRQAAGPAHGPRRGDDEAVARDRRVPDPPVRRRPRGGVRAVVHPVLGSDRRRGGRQRLARARPRRRAGHRRRPARGAPVERGGSPSSASR